MLKQVIIVRTDLSMSKGKLSTQTAHGSVEAALKSDKNKMDEWKKNGMKKVVVKVKNEKELLAYKKKADNLNITNVLIKDAAKTFFDKPTITCLALGPDDEGKIDKITGKLKLL